MRPGILEADRREPCLCLLARQVEFFAGKRGDRRQQRAIEKTLVQPAYPELDLGPQIQQFNSARSETGRPGKNALIVGVSWHQMGPTQVPELKPVLHQPEDAIVLREFRRLDPADIALGCEGR